MTDAKDGREEEDSWPLRPTTYVFSTPAELYFEVIAATEDEARAIARHILWSNKDGIQVAELGSDSGARGLGPRLYTDDSPPIVFHEADPVPYAESHACKVEERALGRGATTAEALASALNDLMGRQGT